MAGDRGKKTKLSDTSTTVDDDDSDHIDAELVLRIEKLQETQDELEKGFKGLMDYYSKRYWYCYEVARTKPRTPLRRALVARLKEIDGELKKVNEEASDKVLEIEQHYNGKRRPVYVKRNEIIKTIADFWLTAFLSHPALGDLLTDEDQKIFKYIDSLDVEDFNDVKSGYFITFEFKPNPYFEDTKLTKTFAFCDEGSMKITGTNIKWKEGMGSANGVDHGKTGNKRPAPEESFFNWFSEMQQTNGEGLIRDEVAEVIKEDLWLNPLKYFSNDSDEEPSMEDEDQEQVGNNGEE